LDEGFGTLDSETLDAAPNALESLRLSDITSRYVLRAVDLKDTVVIDLWNVGGQRPAEILIRRRVIRGSDCRWPWHFRAEQQSVQAGIIFFGEGFGTLDSETLDAALNALESLRLSSRTIGVISHIDQLTRRIPVRIYVKRTGVGTSTIHAKG